MNAKMLRTIVGASLLLFGASAAAGEPTIKFNRMFVLGDSLSDQGNLFFATSALADTFNLPPVPATDHYYRGRFSRFHAILADELYASTLDCEPVHGDDGHSANRFVSRCAVNVP
jgi:hypothetical protein